MKIPIYQVDAFSETLFGGNPAAICPLEDWLTDEQMQKIAMENNLAETAFLVKNGSDYDIRWFTPTVEVKLCGHATLASAHVLFNTGSGNNDSIVFHSKSGPLRVTRNGDLLTLDFPATPPAPVTDAPSAIFEGLHIDPVPVFKSAFDYMVVLPSQKIIEALQPDFKLLASLDSRGLIATAPGDEADFVSRCFFPQSGIDEDPVTGSAHTAMVPYWSQRLGKIKLKAIQLSKRRGYLDCELAGDRVLMSGHAVTYLEGEIYA
ncbi:MAG: PhzF family phenazine biosynthesis protein [Bacteroidetes bacterium]|nr:PhzF family phenazine biosynthesis protein [Bacteroidota bacterium]